MKIGFIGLGIMGKPMAYRLIKGGHNLVVFNRTKSKMKSLIEVGAIGANSPVEVAEKSDIVITMLPNASEVEAVVLGRHGVLEGAKSGMILIDMSSIAPSSSIKISEKCTEHNVHMLDAPVSGGEVGAIEGSLSIMVGGDEQIFNYVKEDVLLQLGTTATYCGTSGAGNIIKLMNQMIVAGNIAILAEALSLAKQADLDLKTVVHAIRNGLAGSHVLETKFENMLTHEFKPGFKIDLHLKDLTNCLEFGELVSADLPISTLVQDMLKQLVEQGYGSYDHSALSLIYKL